VMTANADVLAGVKGMGETSVAAIKAAHGIALRLLKVEASHRPVLSNWQALLDYLTADMAHASIERVRVLHLDSRNRLIRDEVTGEGTIDEAPVYAREVIRRAIQLGSAAIILVHNHPSGDATPSRADIDVTRTIASGLKPLGIALHDHIIIARGGHTSLRAQGII
jgi:DNA repair protein RadC